MSHTFHPTVLREYDIRGIIGETLGPDDARAESDSQAGLERLLEQIDEQLEASGLERGAQAGH